jgi:hypothetical protein
MFIHSSYYGVRGFVNILIINFKIMYYKVHRHGIQLHVLHQVLHLLKVLWVIRTQSKARIEKYFKISLMSAVTLLLRRNVKKFLSRTIPKENLKEKERGNGQIQTDRQWGNHHKTLHPVYSFWPSLTNHSIRFHFRSSDPNLQDTRRVFDSTVSGNSKFGIRS